MPRLYPPVLSDDGPAHPQDPNFDPLLWKQHILGNKDAGTWLERAGGLSTLRIRLVDGGWPYALINGKPLKYPTLTEWRAEDPPLHPSELCRSVTTDDECWLFTCECSVAYCGGIQSGILVGHDGGLIIWRCRDAPNMPLAVFDEKQYRKTVLLAMKRLLRNPPQYSGLNWTMGVGPKYLRSALNRARAGKRWF